MPKRYTRKIPVMVKIEKNSFNILFIGNSHTYFNDMPLMVQWRAEEDGYDCRVVMLAHGDWYLAQHVEEPDVRFNILFGGYDSWSCRSMRILSAQWRSSVMLRYS